MISDNAGSAVRSAWQPILQLLVSFPIAAFCGALVTDVAYMRTADMIWADFSAWLLAVGMVMGVLTALAGVIYILADRRNRARSIWPVVIGSLLVLILGLFDNFVHSRDAWTSVMPTGLALSAVTVVVMLITLWLNAARAPRLVVLQHSDMRS